MDVENSTFRKIEEHWIDYEAGDPEQALEALNRVILLATNKDDGSIMSDQVLGMAFFRMHLVYDYIGEEDVSRKAAIMSYRNRGREAVEDSFEIFYFRMYYSISMLDSRLPWVKSDFIDLINDFVESEPNDALSSLLASIDLIIETENDWVQFQILLPIQYFRKYRILSHLGELDRSAYALQKAKAAYRFYNEDNVSDEEIYRRLSQAIDHLDTQIRWVRESGRT